MLARLVRADDQDGAAAAQKALLSALVDRLEGRVDDALGAAQAALAHLDQDALLSEAHRRGILSAMRPAMLAGWAKEIADPVADAVSAAYGAGRDAILDAADLGDDEDEAAADAAAQADDAAIAALSGDAAYWIGNAWDGGIGEDIAGLLQEEMEGDDATVGDAAAALDDDDFAGTFLGRAAAYLATCAAAGLWRARSFGAVSGLERSGVRAYRIAAAGGDPCEVCQALDGAIFDVADATGLRDEWMAEDDPERRTDIMPFPSASDVDEAGEGGDDGLANAGIALPPWHPHCFCVPEPIYDDDGDG